MRHSLIIGTLVCLLGVQASWSLAQLDHAADLAQARREVRLAISPVAAELARQLSAAVSVSQGVAAAITSRGAADPEELGGVARELMRGTPEVRNVAIAPGNVVALVFPAEGNEAVLGLDYARNEAQWPGVELAMREDRPVVVGPLPLVQGGAGVIARRPVRVPDPSAPDGARYWGLVSTVIDFEQLLAMTGIGQAGRTLELALRNPGEAAGELDAFWGDRGVLAENPIVVPVALPNGAWDLAAIPRGGWPSFRALGSRSFRFGAGLSLVLGTLVAAWLKSRAARRAETALREHAESRARGSENLWEALATMSPVGIFRTDAEGNTTFVNARWTEITGITPAAARGGGWASGLHPQDAARVEQEWQRARSMGTASESVHRFVRPDGGIVWVAGRAVPERDGRGVPAGYIGTLTDITSHMKAQEELSVLNEEIRAHAATLELRVAERTQELDSAMRRAREADRLKSVFLATMSHELRTPLNSIIGFTGILVQKLAGPLLPEQEKQLSMVQESARHLLALINDVLDISKIEAGQLQVESAPFDLRGTIGSAMCAVSPAAERKGLALHTSIAPEIGTVIGDQRRTEQILLNLLSNAIRFTEQGEVRVACERRGAFAQISVSDTGVGIREEDLPRLFQPFQQLDSGTARRHDGTGLGLAISRNLVLLLGGEIGAVSEWGRGSTFHFTIPVARNGT